MIFRAAVRDPGRMKGRSCRIPWVVFAILAMLVIPDAVSAALLVAPIRQDSIQRVGNAPCRLQLSQETVAISQPFNVTVTVPHLEHQRVRFEELPEWLGVFHVRRVEDLPALKTDSGLETTRVLTLEALESGQQEVPSIRFNLIHETSARAEATESGRGFSADGQSPSTIVRVLTTRGEGEPVEQLRDLAGVLDIPQTAPVNRISWWTVGGVAVAGLALATALFWWTRQGREKPVLLADWAIARLNELQSGHEPGQTVVDRWSRASGVLRDYFNLRFGLSSVVGTFEETVGQMTEQGWSPRFIEQLERWLRRADEVAFAGAVVDETQLEAALQQAISLIEQGETLEPVLDQNDQPVVAEENA